MLAVAQQQQEDIIDENNEKMELEETGIEFEKMDLKIYKHRKHNSYHHPKFMLNDDETDWYISAINPHFKKNENDWIILCNKQQDTLCMPLFGEIQCNGYMQDVKLMRFEIGNFDKNEWIPLMENNAMIELKQSKNMQRFEFDIDDENIAQIAHKMQKENYTHLKMNLVENHGAHEDVYSKFVVARFRLFGIIIGKNGK